MKPEMKLRQISPSVLIFGASIIILILLSYGWRLQVFDVFPFEYDEGIHLVLGKLWAAGYIPYQEIFVSYPPSFMWSLGIPWKIFHQVQANAEFRFDLLRQFGLAFTIELPTVP